MSWKITGLVLCVNGNTVIVSVLRHSWCCHRQCLLNMVNLGCA